MTAIETAGNMRTSYLKTHIPEKKLVRDVPLDNLFRGDSLSPFDAPQQINAEPPRLGDRVMNLTSTGVPFSLIGTVVAIHNNTGYVEVMQFTSR